MTKYGTWRRNRKGTPYCSRSTNNSSDKLIVIDAKNLCGHAGLLKSSLKPNRYNIIYPDMIPDDITVGKLGDVWSSTFLLLAVAPSNFFKNKITIVLWLHLRFLRFLRFLAFCATFSALLGCFEHTLAKLCFKAFATFATFAISAILLSIPSLLLL